MLYSFHFLRKPCFGPRLNLLECNLQPVLGSRYIYIYIFLAAPVIKVSCIYGSCHILSQSLEDIVHEHKEKIW